MSKEIRVVYNDILKSSGVFKDSGKRYAEIVPKDIGAVPKVTEDSLEHAISAVLDAVAVIHDSLGVSMEVHGDKLKHVHDKYRSAENDVNDLLGRIDDPDGIQPRF